MPSARRPQRPSSCSPQRRGRGSRHWPRAGVDDHLIKPFSPRAHRVMRARQALRRAHTGETVSPWQSRSDFGDRSSTSLATGHGREGKEVDLTASRVQAPHHACRSLSWSRLHPHELVSRKALATPTEGYDAPSTPTSRTQRAKLGDDPRNPRWLTPFTAWLSLRGAPLRPMTASRRPRLRRRAGVSACTA